MSTTINVTKKNSEQLTRSDPNDRLTVKSRRSDLSITTSLQYSFSSRMKGGAQMQWATGWSSDPALPERARELTQRALELDPDQAHAHVGLAFSHATSGRLPEAMAAARRAIAIDPNRPGAHLALAMVYAQQGRYLDAAGAMRRMLRLDPRGIAQYGPVAWINYAAGRTEEAVRLWEQGLAANPDMAPMSWPLVHIYESEGRDADARALVEAILAVNPELTTETLGALVPFPDEQGAAFRDSLRRAGMP